jgi:dodecin
MRLCAHDHIARGQESIYTVIELVGSSPISWEDAARNAIDTASKSLWNLRIGEVTQLDVKLDDEGKIASYRARIKFSLKYDNWKVELGWKGQKCRSPPLPQGSSGEDVGGPEI